MEGLSALLLEVDLLDKTELENVLAWSMMEDGKNVRVDSNVVRIVAKNKVKGLLRIPDVIRLKSFDQPSEAQYSQPNLKSVIEMKFPGDVLSPAQQEAYELIAGAAGLRVLYTETCECAEREQWREWVRASEKDPVYKPVQQVTRLAYRTTIEKNQLLVGRIDSEHETARRRLGIQLPHAAGPQWAPAPDARVLEAQNRRAVAGLEMILVAPFVAVAASAVAQASAFGSAASTGTVVAKSAGQAVSYRAVLEAVFRKVLPAAPLASAPAFATALDTGARDDARGTTDWRDYQLSDSATSYVLWENATVNIDE